MSYHHGDLRRALLDTALAAVREHGPAALSLREVARRAGVSHAAPAHHFGDKAGLLTAISTEGWNLLADALEQTARQATSFGEVGVAYVLFATGHPGHFAVMRAPGLVRTGDPDLLAARLRASAPLWAGVADRGGDRSLGLAAWSLVHGLSGLLLEGTIVPDDGQDVAALARSVTAHLRDYQPEKNR